MRKTAILAASVMGMLSAATWAASGAVSSASAPASDAASKPAAAAQGVRARAAGSAKAKDGPTIALIRLSGEVLESPPRLLLFPEESLTLQQWLERFAQARNDKSIDAVALDIDGPGVSRAHAEELADAVARLNAVKPVYAFLTSPGSADYRVASACREVAMDPSDTLCILGVGVEMLYFRGTLDKLGLAPQFVQIGAYKGASEPLSQTQPSREVQEEYGWILDDLYDQLLTQLSRRRRITREEAKAVVDAGILSAEDARKAKLIDRVVERADWEASVEDRVAPRDKTVYWEDDYGAKKAKGLDLSSPLAIFSSLMKSPRREEILDPTIAVVHAAGVITLDGEDEEDLFGEGTVSARRLCEIFARLEEEPAVKAVILRIDSPGGSALASEQIYQAVRRCAKAKPVIASLADMGVSGGYYIATAAGTILADPGAIVGSIGVVSGKVSFTGLLEKIGVSRFEMTRGASAGLEMMRPWTQQEQALIQRHAKLTYETFLARVREGRGQKVPDVEQVAGGRIFTARQAKDKGLVDQIGGLRDAILKAQEASGVREAHFLTLPRTRSLVDLLTGGREEIRLRRRIASKLALWPTGLVELAPPGERAAASFLLKMARLLGREKVLCAMPGYLHIRP